MIVKRFVRNKEKVMHEIPLLYQGLLCAINMAKNKIQKYDSFEIMEDFEKYFWNDFEAIILKPYDIKVSHRFMMVTLTNFFVAKDKTRTANHKKDKMERVLTTLYFPFYNLETQSVYKHGLTDTAIQEISQQMPKWMANDLQVSLYCNPIFRFEAYALQYIYFLKYVKPYLFCFVFLFCCMYCVVFHVTNFNLLFIFF